MTKKNEPTPHQQASVVNRYLTALANGEIGSRRTTERTEQALADVNYTLTEHADELTPVQRLDLVQWRIELEAALDNGHDDIESRFISCAAAYSERKGVTYAAWREMGVPARVLREAGITRKGVTDA